MKQSDEKVERTTITLKPEIKAKLVELCKIKGLGNSAIITLAVSQFYADEKKKARA